MVNKLEILDGEGSITNLTDRDTYKKYSVDLQKNSLLIFRTFYFTGWKAKLDGKDLPIQFQNPDYQGLMLVNVPAGQHTLEFDFGNTKIRSVSNAISIFSLAFFFILILFPQRGNIRRKKTV